MCLQGAPDRRTSSATRCGTISSRRFPRCTGPDGLIPDAQVGGSSGCLRSPSARTSPAVRATQSSGAGLAEARLGESGGEEAATGPGTSFVVGISVQADGVVGGGGHQRTSRRGGGGRRASGRREGGGGGGGGHQGKSGGGGGGRRASAYKQMPGATTRSGPP